MRISSAQINQQGINRMLELSRQVADTQEQMATGKRINTPGDDPVGAARIVRIDQELALREQYQRNIDSADAQLAQEETVLTQIMDVIGRVRELALIASNGVQTADDRRFVAIEIEARFEELNSLVNTRGPEGDYLFGGFRGDVKPFDVQQGQTVFMGDEGSRKLQIDGGQYVAVTDSGFDLFMDVPSRSPVFTTRSHPDNDPLAAASISSAGVSDRDALAEFFPDDLLIEFRPASESATSEANFTVRRRSDNRVVEGMENVSYRTGMAFEVAGMSLQINGTPSVGDRFFIDTTNKRDMLTTVKDLAAGLVDLDPALNTDAFQNMLDDSLSGLDNVTDRILETQAEIGARLNTIDSTRKLHDALNLEAQSLRSDIQDLDFAEAASNLSFQSFLLEAAQQSFVRISGLSLFNSLR